ncbi:hypothetical protein CC86DRAFT_257742, partial [Ophiobolus disseminans]
DEDLTVVEIYFKWLYSRNLPVSNHTDHVQYSRLYVLGEKLMNEAFQNAVIDDYAEASHAQDEWPTRSAVRVIYDGTTTESPARRLLIDMYCWHGDEKWVDND